MPLYNPATSSGGVSDGDKGDITVSGSGAIWSIDPPMSQPYATGSFTIPTGEGAILTKLTLTSSQRATIAGTGRLIICG